MNNSKRSPHRGQAVTGLDNTSNKVNSNKPALKINRVLSAFVQGRTLNRFEAERDRSIADHCLHSTVSEIQKRLGLVVEREWETVPGYQGESTSVCRYWMTEDEQEKARQRLGKRLLEVAA